MVRIGIVCVVLLARAVACAAQEPLPVADPKVLIQLGSIYRTAKNDTEFAEDVRILAAECAAAAGDSRTRMQFAYDAIEVSKLMEPIITRAAKAKRSGPSCAAWPVP